MYREKCSGNNKIRKGLLTWDHLLDVLTYMMTISSVPITNCEDVLAQLVVDVGHQNIGVLVLLLRVAWNVTNTCCKSKLSDAIEPFEGFFQNKLFRFYRRL